MQRALIVIGLVIVVAGLLWPWLSTLPLGRLPGDIVIRRESYTFYLPITTMIVASLTLSLVLSLILWLLRQQRAPSHSQRRTRRRYSENASPKRAASARSSGTIWNRLM